MRDVRSDRLSDLYQRALVHPPAQRERFLHEACGSDVSLRQELESLLKFERGSERFMEAPAIAIVAPGTPAAEPAIDMSGRTLGPYTLTSRLGLGGMGEVYRARDNKLGREVAIKLLPPHLTDDPERRARLGREARVLATLNHPQVGAIYGLEEFDGAMGLVLELVRGETLADRLERRRLPIADALAVARQVAEALVAAHEKGIVHRDLKPANIMLQSGSSTGSGVRVKVLDFGLAKPAALDSNVDLTQQHADPAETRIGGRMLGTPSYMSPEQARGLPVDTRTDIWAFGCVLFEMLSGTRVFDGGTMSDTIARILEREPDWKALPSETPAPYRRLLERCLRKDPAKRLHDVADALLEIDDAIHGAEREAAAKAGGPRVFATWRTGLLAVTAGIGLMLLGALTSMAVSRSAPAPVASSYRFTPFSFEPGGQRGAVWSPDGRAVAYAARQNTSSPYQLYVRYLDAPIGGQVTHLTTSVFPVAWSPDSRRVFLLGGGPVPALWSVATVGGDPELFMTLPESTIVAPDAASVAISPDNRSVAVLLTRPVLQVAISSPAGSPLKAYAPAPFESRVVFERPRIRFSPDGRQLLLLVNAGREQEEAWLLPYPGGGRAVPERVLPDLPPFGGTPMFHWLPDSRHIVLSLQTTPEGAQQLWLADTASGERYPLAGGTTGKFGPSVSPDGQRLIFTEHSGNYDVVSIDLTTAGAQRLIGTHRNDLMPAWAAAEPALVYVTDRSGPSEIWLHRPGSPDRPLVTARDLPGVSTQWFGGPALSPKGDRVIYAQVGAGTTSRLWISSVTGGTAIQLTNDTAVEFPGSWSPDGAWFVYAALREGKATLLKVKTSGQATPIVLKEGPLVPTVPAWSPAGDWIAYGDGLISPDGKMTRSLGPRHSPHYAFSRDGALVYGIRPAEDRQVLFSIGIATGTERVIGTISNDFTPGSDLSPSIRFSLSPDGKSFVYGSGRFTTNLWMLEGFARPRRSFAALFR